MDDLILGKIEVNSKKIESIAYNPESYTMEIDMKNGDMIRYFGIPNYIFENFILDIGAYISFLRLASASTSFSLKDISGKASFTFCM